MPNIPSMQKFWEDYERMMQNTFDNTQKMINNMGAYMRLNNETPDTNFSASAQGWAETAKPKISIDDDSVVITFATNQYVDQANTKIYLEGYHLIVDGIIQSRVPLPAAVLKYGGRAVAKQGALEIFLRRDKYSYRQMIPIESG